MYQGESEPVGACGWVGSGLDERLMREQGGGVYGDRKDLGNFGEQKGAWMAQCGKLGPKAWKRGQ